MTENINNNNNNNNKNNSQLQSKLVVITGGAGEIGRVIVRRFLEEGAAVVITGRNEEKLSSLVAQITQDEPRYVEYLHFVVMDNSLPDSVAAGVAQISSQFAKVDILINNAGSAGPKQKIKDLPFTRDELSTDSETVYDAFGSLLLGPWLLTKYIAPHLNNNASIINISTIFSKTPYFGRSAYVVPKAALNQLSEQMAIEFAADARNIRVNTVYPGPVDGERINNVFSAMDKLRNADNGTTKKEFTSIMLSKDSSNNSHFIAKDDIAEILLYLGSEKSKGLDGHDFYVSHGMQLPNDAEVELLQIPDIRMIDLDDSLVWIIVGNNVLESIAYAHGYLDVGAKILLTTTSDSILEQLQEHFRSNSAVLITKNIYNQYSDWQDIAQILKDHKFKLNSVIVLPNFDAKLYDNTILNLTDEKIVQFVQKYVCEKVLIAKKLDALLQDLQPKIIYVGINNDRLAFDAILNAGTQELIRVWRQERGNGNIYQILCNEYLVAQDPCPQVKLAIYLSGLNHNFAAINICIGENADLCSNLLQQYITNQQNILGMHLHKIALVTGGSEGIGAAITRLLLISGAKVAVAARDPQKLNALRETSIDLMHKLGYADAENRILIITHADIGQYETPSRIVNETIAAYGHIDYLINNAGIAGAEQMVVDMELEDWRQTIKANLSSNYELINLLLPSMKQNKFGHIINMSSHFGGARNTTVVYPNRADYALSKSGQRILAENLAGVLGPEIQINAVAPGPVEGLRITGSSTRLGLYQKRSRLILENKRLNLIYEWSLNILDNKSSKAGSNAQVYLDDELYMLAENNIHTIANLISKLSALTLPDNNEPLMDKGVAQKLINRLKLGMFVSPKFSDTDFFAVYDDSQSTKDAELFSAEQINAGANRIKNKMLHSLALQHMPTELDVAREVVFYLSNNNVTGETFYPSCGLSFEQFVTETEWIGEHVKDHNVDLNGKIVYLIGNTMFEDVADIICAYLQCDVAKIVILTNTFAKNAIYEKLIQKNINHNAQKLYWLTIEQNEPLQLLQAIPSVINQLIVDHGAPSIIISLPLKDINQIIMNQLPNLSDFEQIMDLHIANNFILAKRACLLDNCRMIVVTQKLSTNDPMAKLFASFVKNSLRTLTATVAKEATLLSHNALFYQLEPNGNAESLVAAIVDLSSYKSIQGKYHSGMIIKV